MTPSRRRFLRLSAAAALSAPWAPWTPRALPAFASPAAGARSKVPRSRGPLSASERAALGFPVPERQWRGDSSVAASMRSGTGTSAPARAVTPTPVAPDPVPAASALARFRDLPRHFVFEYYPWYRVSPWEHWDEAGRTPPDDIAATSLPRLGPYDSLDLRAIEQHARWIAETGVGAINVSWWGRGSSTDRAVHPVMDVMRDHGIHVTFHLEPYRDDRSSFLLDDISYLLEEYGERRRWDAFLLLEDASGRSGPVFKLFRTIVPERGTDCHGDESAVPDYIPDAEWRRQTDRVRAALDGRFDAVTLLADSLDMGRTPAAGFDGIAIYDNFVAPSTWREWADLATAAGLVFSFNVNPGFDGVILRGVPPDSCYRPPRFEPGGGEMPWSEESTRADAQRRAAARIDESFDTTLALQTSPQSSNAKQGFFLVYVNSFNEWHEGHQFEPALSAHELSAPQRAVYHNPPDGDARLAHLRSRISEVLRSPD